MDPLSAAASVIAVLQLASDVVSYISAAKGASKEWKRLSYEVLGCELILERIREDLQPAATDDRKDGNQAKEEGIKALEGVGGPLGRLWKALSFVRDKIEPKRGLRKAVSTLKWPFDSKEVDKIIAVIEREKALLNLALTSDARRLIQEVKDTSVERSRQISDLLKDLEVSSSKALASIQESQANLQTDIDQLRQHNDDLERDVVLGWLSSSNYPSQHSDLLRRRQPGTGQWILESPEYQEWLTNEGRTLFCPGIPGAGKTIVTSMVIDELDTRFGNDSRVGIAYVYCSFRRKEEDADYLSLALLKQLYQQLDTLPDGAYRLYREFKPKQAQPPFLDIAQALKDVAALYSRVFVLVDALDEANSVQRATFVRNLFALQADRKVNIFATSRFIPEIVNEFASAQSLEIRASDKDIEKYLDGRMPELPCFPDWSEKLQTEIRSKIMEAVDGMFILAEIYLSSLEDKATPRAVRKALSQFERQIPGSTETQRREVLDKAYQQAMERITGQKLGFRNLALKALCWITCAARPLSPPELQHALAVEDGDSELDEDNIPLLERVVSICAGLVTIDQESQVIRLVHYTTQEFFQETWQDWFPEAHDDITTVCITYLSFKQFEAGMCKTFEEYTERLRVYSLYLYAVFFFARHSLKASDKVKPVVAGFFDEDRLVEASLQAFLVADKKERYEPFFEPENKKDALYLATCLGLYELMQTLLERRRVGLPDARIVAEGEINTTTDGSPDSASLDSDITTSDDADVMKKEFVEELREQQQVEEMRSGGYTLLHMAAKNVKEKVLSHLLDQGADIEARTTDGQTPLHLAAGVYQPAVMRHLYGESAGHAGVREAKKGTDVTARLLLEKGAAIDARESLGRTSLHIAAQAGNEAVLKLLIDRGADIEAKDSQGRTPLLLAIHRPAEHESDTNLSVISALLEQKADTEARSKDGWTALLMAVQYDLQRVAKVLLDKGADIEAQDENGRTPISIAKELFSWDMIHLLERRLPQGSENGLDKPMSTRLPYVFKSSSRDEGATKQDDEQMVVM